MVARTTPAAGMAAASAVLPDPALTANTFGMCSNRISSDPAPPASPAVGELTWCGLLVDGRDAHAEPFQPRRFTRPCRGHDFSEPVVGLGRAGRIPGIGALVLGSGGARHPSACGVAACRLPAAERLSPPPPGGVDRYTPTGGYRPVGSDVLVGLCLEHGLERRVEAGDLPGQPANRVACASPHQDPDQCRRDRPAGRGRVAGLMRSGPARPGRPGTGNRPGGSRGPHR